MSIREVHSRSPFEMSVRGNLFKTLKNCSCRDCILRCMSAVWFNPSLMIGSYFFQMKGAEMKKTARVGWLADLTGVSPLNIRRLVSLGAIPAKRLPGSKANWRFSTARLTEILDVLAASGLIDEADVQCILARAATAEASSHA